MKYTIHNLNNGLYWDDTCELFRTGGLVHYIIQKMKLKML